MVPHRFATARAADLIVLLEDGRVVEPGTHEELVRAGGAYAEPYGLQARSYRAAPGPRAGGPGRRGATSS